MIDRYRARMVVLHAAFERDGCLYAVSARNPGYSILLTKNVSSDARFRVTSFDGREPTGHREYDFLDGGSPTQNALSEFAGTDLVLMPRPRRRTSSAVPAPT